MTEKRIQFSNIVFNQLPAYVREEFPLVSEFLSQYYRAQEFQGAPIDLIQNIDKYVKVDEMTHQTDSVILINDITSFDDVIFVGISSSPTGTAGFPEKYGLLKIDDEIITYTGKTFNSFTGCVRGFSGIDSYSTQNHPDQLTFSESNSASHSAGSTIINLSSLFLKEFLSKIKYQLSPGFENRDLSKNLNQALFIKQSKDFYRSKGTKESFEILFRFLYGEDVSIIDPKEYLFRPSDAHYQITTDLVVESIEGNPENLKNCTLIQDTYPEFTKAYAPITNVEKIVSKNGKEYYKLSIDSGYSKDIGFDGALYGEFKVHPQTKVIGQYNLNTFIVTSVVNPGTPPPNKVWAINGITQQQLTLVKGNTYRFDTSDSSNSEHILIFQTTSGDSLSSLYYIVSGNGVAGQAGSFVDLTINITAPDEIIKYNCSLHSEMGANIAITADPTNNLTTLNVDSTIGFPNSGNLYVTYNDQTQGTIGYESKSVNQFFNCSNITGIIEDSANIGISTYAHKLPFEGSGENVRVRITSVIKDFKLSDDTYYLKKGYTSQIKTLGVNSKDVVSNNWFFNIATSYDVQSISLIDNNDKSYKINTKLNNIFKVGDSLKIIDSANNEKTSTVIDVTSEKSFNIKGQGELSLTDSYTIKRNLLKVNSPTFSNASILNANVQNVYKQNDKTLIASPSLPYYNQQLNLSSKQIVFSGTFNSDTFKITSNIDHGFYTGDAVYYTPEKIISVTTDDDGNVTETSTTLSKLFDEGIYYVKRIDSNNIKLSQSKSNIYNSKFISVDSPVTIIANKLEYYKFKSKTLKSQNLFREISPPINDGAEYPTNPGFTGILINGVEILNYKSNDTVYYGQLDEVEVISSGRGYDIINPPVLLISDLVGYGATANCAVRGSLSEIRVVDSGFDYVETPTIKITGGNGVGAVAKAAMKLVDHQATFNSEEKSAQVSLTNYTIGFSTYHKFRNTEQIIYNTNGQKGIGGISTDSAYFVSVQSPTEVKLHNTLGDVISGINTINLTSHGIGDHQLRSYNKRSILGSINIQSSGSGYENKKKTIFSSITGINTSINQISIVNHEFQSGEIVKYINYSTGGSVIGGLTTSTEYYLTKVDDNNFKLSKIGIGTTLKDFYYNTKQFINLTSVGVGTHTFNYPEISVEVIGNVGISSIGFDNFKAVVQPIFRGEITSTHLENNGSNYGSSEILNYDRQPLVTLSSGSGAVVVPIVSDQKITEILVTSPGVGYNSPPDLVINGGGFGAVLTPIIQNGQLIEVKVIESGIGYSPNNISIDVLSAGLSAEFNVRIQRWNVNLFQKNLSIISNDDGILSEGINENFELEYSHLYAPRKLREIVYSSDSGGNTLYGKKDLRISGNKEILSTDHSPIIGWAYDGNPIYGPYGFSTKEGGIVSQMKSGYKLDLKPNRPLISSFPSGFFIEDYSYSEVSDETVLDKNNGRFCVTPEYPNGAYVYFATINNSDADSSGPFSGYKSPIFPYLIGDNFNSKPNEFNFKKASNQIDLDLNKTSFSRNTNPYNLIENGASYSYLELPNLLNQTVDIKYASPGFIEKIDVISGGSGYKNGTPLVFNNEGTGGYNASAEIERVFGKSVNSISVATTSISNVEFYSTTSQGTFLAFFQNPHNFTNTDLVVISGLNTTSSLIEGSYQVGVATNTIALTAGIGTTATTGIVTYFSVAGNLNYSNIRENDILGIGTEKVKVLNVDAKSSRIRILRAVNGTVGSSHSITTVLYENPRKLTINAGFRSQYDYKINREIYFNPVDAVGLGTTSGIGIGVTLIFSNPGTGITQIFIPTKSIYISNHQLNTGDELLYSTNSGTPIGVSTNGISTSVSISDQSIVYVAKISDDLIGISTFRVGLGTQGTFVGIASTTQGMGTLFFTNVGTGDNHSFKTNYGGLSGNISKNTVTISTAQTHGLLNNDIVFVDVNPSISTTFTLKYNDYVRKVLINPKDFISAGINTLTNIITILNHKFENGQKVIHTANVPAIGLENNKEYFVFIVDTNNIKLTNTYYDSISAKPEIVGITSASSGTLSLINPPIKAYKNSSVVFDLSDSSLSYAQQATLYPAFDFKLFKDSNFTENYNNNSNNQSFDVQKVGIIGITSDAKVTLSINKNTPKNLYYNLIPIYDGTLPQNKKLINEDREVLSNNQIQVDESQYNGKYKITVGSTTSFTYGVAKVPEENLYISGISSIKYETSSINAYGSILKIKITNKGQNYYSLPQIVNIAEISTLGILTSGIGSEAILHPSSTSIGKIKSIKINDIGFDFPSDLTMVPSVAIPQVIRVDSLSSFDSIGISSFGKGYTSAPKLIVLDGKTGNIASEVDLKFTLGNNKVEILKNVFGLNNVTPTILPIQNSNGVGISSVGFNTTTKDVTITLSVGFSTANSFPFAVNDKVLIENVSVGVGSTGKGYNSENYNYQLFTLTSVTENLGGLGGSVVYNLNEFLTGSEFPGTLNSTNSSGRIIAQKQFPIFDIVLKNNNFSIGETVTSGSNVGTVEDWDSKTNFVTILSKNDFKVGDLITGSSTKTQAVANSIEIFNAFLDIAATSKFVRGNQSDAGVLNSNLQRISDNDYYQNFSYSIKSRVDFDKWNDAVSTLNHTTGFKKFSDYQLETPATFVEVNSNSLLVNVPSDLTFIDIISDIVNVVNLNCVYDFDLVKENSRQIGSQIFSDEIIFSNRILTDYAESVGNRVLSIDDISPQFNSNPRATRFSEVHRFSLADVRTQKYLTYVRDTRFTGERQLLIVTSLIDNIGNVFLNQYARVESTYDMGSFDIAIDGTDGVLQFFPTKFTINDFDITTLSYNIDDNILSTGNTTFGDIIDIRSSSIAVSVGTTTTIVGIASTYRSMKVLVSISATTTNQYEFDELNIIHNGTDVAFLEYGQLTNHSLNSYSSTGLGTYYPYLSGGQLKVDFTPNAQVTTTVNVNAIQVAFASTTTVGVGTYDMKHARLEGRSTSIASTSTPTPIGISSYPDVYDSAYFIVQVSDNTNNIHQLSEVALIDDDTDVYVTEYGIINTLSGLGTIGAQRTSSIVELTFTPLANIDVDVKVYLNALRCEDDDKEILDFINSEIQTNCGSYEGTDSDIKREFALTHKNDPIFERYFIGSASTVVNTTSNVISIPNHFFVTGEQVEYTHAGAGTTQAIGIATTSFVSVGSTDKLPEEVYIVKVDINNVKLARSAEDALKFIPKVLDITSVGIGTLHKFVSTNQNSKVIVALDNLIQSPIVSTANTTTLSINAFTTSDIIFFSQITSFFGGDLIKIGDEIMRIDGVGIGSTNAIQVRRPRLGTSLAGYSTGSLVTKVSGNYNIVDNVLSFAEAPFGKLPFSSTTNRPDERDWVGISTGSSFQGRSFIRSGIINSSNEAYHKNYIFSDISSGFNGINKTFTLTSNGTNATGIQTENAIVLINDIFQGPGLAYDYTLLESVGITSITFTGAATSVSYDVNHASIPRGGVIVSVGSTEGFGYQPLVSAGGTVTVSVAGTISTISIGNSGSGYRTSSTYEIIVDTSSPVGIGSTIIYLENSNSVFSILNLLNTGSNCSIGIGTFIGIGIATAITSVGSTFIQVGTGATSSYQIPSGTQTVIKISSPQIGIVNVGVGTSSVGIATITHVGYSTIISGSISTSVTITNPGTGYTSTNPPYVIFDDPLSYSNIPLIYSSSSSGVGTQAKVNIVVGQGSSVIDFEIINTGYGYGDEQILTVPIGGITGIPTTGSSFNEFQLTIQKTFVDKFTGWAIGELQVLDSIDDQFDGTKIAFQTKNQAGNLISILSSKGSNINVQDTLLIFINDVLQVPGKGYTFPGGSIITFAEPPKVGDTSKIIFYRGSGSVDVVDVDVLETVKVGDELTINYDPSLGQSPILQEEERTVTRIDSTDLVKTNPYFGPGNVNDQTLERPVIWCRQTEDKIINELPIGKSRMLYEAAITPTSYLIQPVGIGSTILYVDNVRPFFNPTNENNTSVVFQNSVIIISQDDKVGASATAVVSIAGTVTSIVISDGGVGYTTAPIVSISQPIGFGTTAAQNTALASATISGGVVTGIAVTFEGSGYISTFAPQVLIESPSMIKETGGVEVYAGDSGVIVGFGTTTISSVDQIIFDLHIPTNSYLRDTSVVGTALTLSGIEIGDYFLVYDSNVGFATTSITSRNTSNNVIGIGTNFVDNVYQVESVSNVSVADTAIGIATVGAGTTIVRRIFARISGISTIDFSSSNITFDSTVFTFDSTGIGSGSGYSGGITTSNYFGNFSWGRIELTGRTKENTYNFYGNNGVGGISTSGAVKRTLPLRFENYIIT
jgi:hypothetical protein